MKTNREIDEGGGEDDKVAAEVSIGEEAPEERCERGDTLPVVDAPCGGLQVLVQHPRQVYDQVRRQPEVAQPLAQLHRCIYACIISNAILSTYLHLSIYIDM
jgi:hypothetical protein